MKIILINLIMLLALNMCYAQISDEQAKKIVVEMIKAFEPNNTPEIKNFKQFEKCISSTAKYLNTQNEWAKASNRYKNGYPNILRYKDSLDYTLKKLNYYIYFINKRRKILNLKICKLLSLKK